MIGIIPAAGKGLRFKELGKNYAKAILPYKEKPLLIHQIEWLEQHDCEAIIIVLNHQIEGVKEIINYYNKKVIIKYQETQDGLSSAIFSAIKDYYDEEFLIILGDILSTENIFSGFFDRNFISVKEVNDYSRWCMVKKIISNEKVIFFDKPLIKPETNLAVSGVYFIKNGNNFYNLLNSQIEKNIKINNEYQLSTVLQEIADTENMELINLKIIDFGTLEEYLNNRSVKNSRSFNEIINKDNFIIKSSKDKAEKLIKEFNWFKNLPEEISIHTPRLFSKNFYSENCHYTMEKILAPSLREIYLFLDSSIETWTEIFNSCFYLLDKMKTFGRKNTFMKDVFEKTKNRINQIEIPIENKLVNNFLNDFKSLIDLKNDIYSLMHGDFCFSNLLYDFKSSKIKMIDPRGELFGSHYYEIAKLFHSIIYDYDFVDSELYIMKDSNYKLYNNGKKDIKDLFINKIEERYSKEEIKYIKYITASLFLSMIPLHSHNTNNQKIYYDIFKNIYLEIL